MALRSVLLRITGDPSDAKRALQETANDLRKLDGQEAEARVNIKSEAVKAQIEIVKARLERLSAQEATPKVQIQTGRAVEQLDRLEAKLTALGHKDVNVDVHVDRNGELRALTGLGGGIAGGLSGAARGLTAFVSAATAGVPALSRMTSLLASIGPEAAIGIAVLLPVMGALISSFAAAAAGAVALGVALAGALGPVALVGLVAITKLTQALLASHKAAQSAGAAQQQQASQAAAIASAQDSVRSSTEGLAKAQQNLGEQAVSANRAWADAIQAVKDDLLGVEDAQRGIEDANLSLKEAQQNLIDVRSQAGATGNAFSAVFSKFTDVSVDTSGLKKALTNAAAQSGTTLSGDDELKLERAIQDVRDAKTREKDATEQLHHANVQLTRDRSTEADFAREGIRAFKPYRDAIEGVTQAQRALIASRRQLAQAQHAPALTAVDAPKPPTGPLGDLVATIKHVGDVINQAFGPALDAIFRGANTGLTEFSKSLKDPRIVKALTDIGVAIGGVFVTFGKLFSNKEFRDGFVTLAEGGARLVKVLGQRVFVDFANLLLRIAVAALPDLLRLFNELADKFHTFVAGTRNAEAFRAKIHDLTDSTRKWGSAILDIIDFLARTVRFLNEVFKFGKIALRALVGIAVGVDAPSFIKAMRDGVTGWISGALHDIRGFASTVLNRLGSIADSAKTIGRKIGHGLVDGIKAGIGALVGIGRFIANGLIDAINFAIHFINHGLPDKINLPGLPDINLPNNPIPELPHLAAGGIAIRDLIARIGEGASHEAILPLNTGVFRQMGQGILSATPMLAPAFAGGVAGMHVENFHTNIHAPAGELPDAQHTATAISRLIERRAGGDVRQN